MKSEKRHIESYYPRKSRNTLDLSRQKLYDLEHKLSMELGAYTVLLNEGSQEQIHIAQQKAKTYLLKFSPEMHKIAQEIGGQCPTAVQEYIKCAEKILHAAMGWIDEAILTNYFHASEKLEKQIHPQRLSA